MGELRIPNNTRAKLEELSKVKDLKSALELMVDLQDNYVSHEEIGPVRYNQESGEPLEYGTVSKKRFGTDFPFGGEGFSIFTIKLTKKVVDEIKKCPVIFKVKDNTYVGKFETKEH